MQTGRPATFPAAPTIARQARLRCPRTWAARCAISTTETWTGCWKRRPPKPTGADGRTDGKTSGGRARGKPAPVTTGQEKLILAAFEAGLKPATIAREFRLSRAQVDGVLAAAKQRGR